MNNLIDAKELFEQMPEDYTGNEVRQVLLDGIAMAEIPTMDWEEVAMNGGPPCFAVLQDEDSHRYCGRAERWAGHGIQHTYLSLEELLSKVVRRERKRCAELERSVYMDYESQTINSHAKTIAREVCAMYAAAIRTPKG